eukprot:467443-Rhodomonas_salina.1
MGHRRTDPREGNFAVLQLSGTSLWPPYQMPPTRYPVLRHRITLPLPPCNPKGKCSNMRYLSTGHRVA